MASGSISNAPAPALSRDSTKKKRTNGSAKLKQIKLDVRREQWLSRVAVRKGCSVDSNGRVEYPPPSRHIANEQNVSSKKANRRERGQNVDGSSIQDNVMAMGSLANSPILINFDSGSKSSSSSIMCNCVSENASNEQEDDCLDDWEAVADALNADNNMQDLVLESATGPETSNSSAGPTTTIPIFAPNPGVDLSKKECRSAVPESRLNCLAWKPDDALRPQCLPNLSRQHSSLLNSDWQGDQKTIPLKWQSIIFEPSCPICYEDLDVTDSSFLPCSCGFRLCLFCHKRILEADGRCPGCRKPYDHMDTTVGFNVGAAALHIPQSCSMGTGC